MKIFPILKWFSFRFFHSFYLWTADFALSHLFQIVYSYSNWFEVRKYSMHFFIQRSIINLLQNLSTYKVSHIVVLHLISLCLSLYFNFFQATIIVKHFIDILFKLRVLWYAILLLIYHFKVYQKCLILFHFSIIRNFYLCAW